MDSEFKIDVENDGGDKGKHCLYLPVFEAFVGLEFTYCDLWCSSDAFFRVGYEVQHWSDWREFSSNEDLASLGLGGLTVRLGFAF